MPKTYYDSELSAAEIESVLQAIHGVVSPSNNGKILGIESGRFVAKSASEYSGAAVLEPLNVSANGDYYPRSGTDGFDEVHVSVPGSTLTTKNITQNGTYNASSDNADGYSSVVVNVSGGGAVVQPLSVTQNGTYNPPSGVDGYAPVTVNVSGGGGGGPNIFGLFSLATRNENSMTWQKTPSSLKATWNGGADIGADSFVMINLTDVSSISVDVETGGSYTDTNAKWYVYLAVMDTNPSRINYPANQYQTYFKAYDEFHTRNSGATLTIDVSSYTGLNYLIISAIGWNAEFTNLVVE